MLPSSAQSPDWLYSEPLLFDEDFCQTLMKDLQSLPTPPQSPPMKAGLGEGKPLSQEDQLSYVSDILLEDQDMQHLGWTSDFFHSKEEDEEEGEVEGGAGGEDCLWQCLVTDRSLEEKLVSSMLGCSPLLSDIDTSIFEEIAGSTLDCQNLLAAAAAQDAGEATSDYGSTGGEMSTYSSSDSEEEIDVVTVVRCPSRLSPSPSDSSSARKRRQQQLEEEQRALQRHSFEIQLQHNYAAPCPASPPPPPLLQTLAGGRTPPAPRLPQLLLLLVLLLLATEDEEERRRTHNVMERQRRNELKNCFVRLRDNVPELSHNDKASKVVILKKARDCIYGLEGEGHRLQSRRDKLRAKQQELRARLEALRS
nr:unnamed protein product [Menidia menidia]